MDRPAWPLFGPKINLISSNRNWISGSMIGARWTCGGSGERGSQGWRSRGNRRFLGPEFNQVGIWPSEEEGQVQASYVMPYVWRSGQNRDSISSSSA